MLSPEDILVQGVEYCQNGNLAKGIEMFRQALTLNPRLSTKMVLNHNLATVLCQQAGVVWGPDGRCPINEHNISFLDEAVELWSEVCEIYQFKVEGTDEEYEFVGTPRLREYMKMASNNGFAISVKLDQYRGIGPFKKEKKSSSGCFFATAAFGDHMAPEVIYLHHYRDKVLNKTTAGRTFIHIYWIFSPYIARFISKSVVLKMLTREILLRPMIRLLSNFFDE